MYYKFICLHSYTNLQKFQHPFLRVKTYISQVTNVFLAHVSQIGPTEPQIHPVIIVQILECIVRVDVISKYRIFTLVTRSVKSYYVSKGQVEALKLSSFTLHPP